MCRIQDLSDTDSGMMGRVHHFHRVLLKNDSLLMRHLETQQVLPIFFVVRWIKSMLTQDMEMPDILRTWDALLGRLSGPHPLLIYLCVARVILVRNALLVNNTAGCLRLLQRAGYPPVSVKDMLDLALRLITNETLHCKKELPQALISLRSASNSTKHVANAMTATAAAWWRQRKP